MNETSWSLGVLIGLPVWILLLIVLTVCVAFGFFLVRRDGRGVNYWSDGELVLVWSTVFFVLVFLSGALLFYPYKAEYHQWRTMGGEVVKIDSRLLDGANQKFVVTFANGDQLGCNDTRCAAIETGDVLWLSCKRTWQYAGTDGWDCNFVKAERSRS